jgi:hypothetical protein
MTPQEFKTALQAFRKEVGPRAEVWAQISCHPDHDDKSVLYGSIYPEGICNNNGYLKVFGDDFASLLSALKDGWAKQKNIHRARTIRKMALEIIKTTADLSECTDASLRSAGFTSDEIAQYGSLACGDANTIAGKGPFRIKVKGSNGAPK